MPIVVERSVTVQVTYVAFEHWRNPADVSYRVWFPFTPLAKPYDSR